MAESASTNGFKPGIYMDMPRIQYEGVPAANYSTLKLFARTAAHAQERILHPTPPTPSMELGSALHMAVLEPARFAAEYVRAPKCDRRTTAGKAEWAAFEAAHLGRNYLGDKEWEQCEGMMRAAEQHDVMRQLLYGPGANEVTILWNDAETGAKCRARMDRFTTLGGWSMVVDVKSAIDASQWAFARQVVNLGYHVQAAFYLDGLRTLADRDRRFIIAAIESAPPFCPVVYELDDAALEVGRRAYRRYLAQYLQCHERNEWPGYEVGIHPLSLPAWAERGIGDES